MNKLHHLHHFLSTNDPDIVFVTETWLSSNVCDSEIVGGLPYVIFRNDRKTGRGGGVCCLCKDVLCIKQSFLIQEPHLIVWFWIF